MKKGNPEEILGFFRKIEDCLLIVEGKKDAKALNTLGITNILAINRRPLIAIVEKVAELRDIQVYSDIIILTDFDREGRHIAARLSRLLRAHRIHPNQRLRSRIMNFGFNKIEDIKMDSIMKIEFEKRGDVYVKTSSNFNKVRDKGYNKGKRCGREA